MEDAYQAFKNEPQHDAEEQGVQDIVFRIIEDVDWRATRPILAEKLPCQACSSGEDFPEDWGR